MSNQQTEQHEGAGPEGLCVAEDSSGVQESGHATLSCSPEQFEMVMGRLKVAFAVSTDAALCKLLGIAPNAYANRKSSGSIPFEAVIAACKAKGIGIDPIFATGRATTATPVLGMSLRELESLSSALQEAEGLVYDVRRTLLAFKALEQLIEPQAGGQRLERLEAEPLHCLVATLNKAAYGLAAGAEQKIEAINQSAIRLCHRAHARGDH